MIHRNPFDSPNRSRADFEIGTRMHRFSIDLDNDNIVNMIPDMPIEEEKEENGDQQQSLAEEIENAGADLGILTCTIWYSNEFHGFKICRFCSSSSCSLCWNRVLTGTKKCPFCRKSIKADDLVKSKLANELKEEQDRKGKEFDRTCPVSGDTANIFCETCSKFVCTKCLAEGTHTGHTLTDVEQNSELKSKLTSTQNFKNKIQSISESLNEAIADHLEFVDSDMNKLDSIADDFRASIVAKIDSCLEVQKQKLALEKSKLTDASEELQLLKEAQEEVFQEDYRKLSISDLEARFLSVVQEKKGNQILKILKKKKSNSSKFLCDIF